MNHSARVYRVPAGLRLHTAIAALAVCASIPPLLRAGPWTLALPVLQAGLFSASIALSGHDPGAGTHD